MAKQISPERKGLYSFGVILQVIGGCLFAMPFIGAIGTMIFAASGNDPNFMFVAIAFGLGFLGFALIGVGGGMRGIAARGVAGSGLVLDPEKAREDLKPWTGMAGGMVKDVLDEADIKIGSGGSEREKIVMIKCRECGKLNEEDSKFCQECGKSL